METKVENSGSYNAGLPDYGFAGPYVASEIKESILDQTLGQMNEFRALNERGFQAEKQAIIAGYESRLQTKDNLVRIDNKIDRETDHIKRQVREFEIRTEKNFDVVNRNIDEKFHNMEKTELREQLADVKQELKESEQLNLKKAIVDELKDFINSFKLPKA